MAIGLVRYGAVADWLGRIGQPIGPNPKAVPKIDAHEAERTARARQQSSSAADRELTTMATDARPSADSAGKKSGMDETLQQQSAALQELLLFIRSLPRTRSPVLVRIAETGLRRTQLDDRKLALIDMAAFEEAPSELRELAVALAKTPAVQRELADWVRNAVSARKAEQQVRMENELPASPSSPSLDELPPAIKGGEGVAGLIDHDGQTPAEGPVPLSPEVQRQLAARWGKGRR